MSIDATLKCFSIIILLFVAQFQQVNNVERTKANNLINVGDYDAKTYYDDYLKSTNYLERRKRSKSEDLFDDEDVERVSEKLRKKHIRQNRRRKKHRGGKKKKIENDKEKERKISESLTSEAERNRELRGDAVGNPCVAGPCVHGGTCIWNRDGQPTSFRCDCKLGYQGSRCEREIEECESLPCKERGECVATSKGFLCLCKDGYGGKFCEVSQKTHTLVTESHSVGRSDGIVISGDVLQTIYITLGVVGTLLGVIILSLCIHCCRVWNKRLEYTQTCRKIIENGGSISELPPGICEISNSYCREFWCCGCCDIKDQSTEYDELLAEFKNTTRYLQRPNSPIPDYQRRLVQSEGAFPKVKHSYRSFRSLPAQMQSFTKRPSWLRGSDFTNDADSADSIRSTLPPRTRPRGPSPSRKSSTTPRSLPKQVSYEGTDTEGWHDRIEDTNIHHQGKSFSSSDASPHHHSDSSQYHRHSLIPSSPSHSPNRPSHQNPNQHSSQPVFTKRASVRNILAHLSETHPPLPNLPPDQSVSSSTFS
ncbi:uncharacterized protein LOC117321677 [Pecten maximus]|uniref:uncharacterized protein LOC117321677 n=1 Tax=Pecten maximus TaxID=6579 RepID=UPI001457F3C6|nr:uncharacterized protein LOC117321677 [Pecten maximus]